MELYVAAEAVAKTTCRRLLKEDPKWKIWAREVLEVQSRVFKDYTWIGLHTRIVNFDVNIIDNVFYVLSVWIDERLRGQGFGSALYNVLELTAKELGCKRIQQYPSGWATTGETRKSWLMRRGWQAISHYDGEVFKMLT